MEEKNLFAILLVVFLGAVFYLSQKRQVGDGKKETDGSILQKYTTDLTQRAREEKIDPVVGRDEEIERVIHILARRSKNNPLLLGEPGVGKTAIVEGLARRIAKGSVPSVLKNKRLLSLDLPGMISGTKYRGEFEQRMRHLTDELERANRSIILFIDEVHMLEQANGSEGSMNVSDILKPALSRGELAAIGATTWREYNQLIKPDDALNRRFQPVLVGEPSREAVLQILHAVRPVYERHHQVHITDEALAAAIDLSTKHITERFLPDKAIDLVDEAAAAVSIEAALGHTVALGVVNEAARLARSQEERRLKEELAHLRTLEKEYPSDAGIEKADRAIEGHLRELSSGGGREIKEGVPLVSPKDIETVLTQWKAVSQPLS
jgi:ATP-dependent Clp protease ATP-binding subunit ClpC